jgi:hypothetical protein
LHLKFLSLPVLPKLRKNVRRAHTLPEQVNDFCAALPMALPAASFFANGDAAFLSPLLGVAQFLALVQAISRRVSSSLSGLGLFDGDFSD